MYKLLIKLVLFLTLISSCETFTGEHTAESYVLFQTLKHKDYCISTLYIDGEYIARALNKSCRVYYENKIME
tara:strand:+ start:1021 stop:1236 length:216 start_codon:yes stop_codon:yes gene_type:complete